ncbi:MAG: hypothetical protein IKG82_03685 [Oscillospiraceae bacterium]|nr:hypothetical protein [Oscillospiraceae bacterium]MBR6717685.1 hypothetical protein [Oscillospiraceae bacterium]
MKRFDLLYIVPQISPSVNCRPPGGIEHRTKDKNKKQKSAFANWIPPLPTEKIKEEAAKSAHYTDLAASSAPYKTVPGNHIPNPL